MHPLRRLPNATRAVLFLTLAASAKWDGERLFAQSTKPPQPPLRLADPTPRPRDVNQIYNDLNAGNVDPAKRTQQEQAAALARQQSRAQALTDAGGILALADQLRYDTAHPDRSGPTPLDRMAIQKIEKLARDVRTRMQIQ